MKEKNRGRPYSAEKQRDKFAVVRAWIVMDRTHTSWVCGAGFRKIGDSTFRL